MRSFATLLLALSLPLYALAAHSPIRRHNGLALRARGDLLPRQTYDNARCTFYDITTGTTACGGNFQASDFVVALDSDLFGSGYPGPNCFRTIQISYNGKTATATIQDECPGCPSGGLDMTTGLFDYFADPSVGVIYATWSYVDGSSGNNGGNNSPANTPDTDTSSSSTPQDTPTYVPPSPTPTPTPTPTPDYTPTTTYTPPPSTTTTTSYPPPPPTTSSTPTTTTSPTTSPPPPSSTPSPSPTPTPNSGTGSGSQPDSSDGENLGDLTNAMNSLANLVLDCGDE